MLQYSNNLYNKIQKIRKYLIIGNKYKVVGSFGKNKYVTDVDITNYVSSKINFNDEIIKIINNLPDNVIFLNLTSGIKPEFSLPWTIINEKNVKDYEYVKSINFINNLYFLKLINEEERDYCNNLLEENPKINNLVLIEDKLYNKSKNKFSKENILDKKLKTEFIENENNVVHYIYKYDDDIIPIDVGFVKSDINKKNTYYNEFDKKKYLMFLKKEYYFILSSMRRYLDKEDQKIVNELLNDKYGSYRQILMNIFYLIQLINFPVLQTSEYYKFCYLVIKKIKENTNFNDKCINIIKKSLKEEIDITNNEWYNLLKELEDKLTQHLNEQLKDYAYDYYKKIFNQNRMKYDYLAFDLGSFK